MALTSGTRLGPYEVTASIGAGGMGEVYRAHDSKLHRDVALKVLPEAFTADADRLARFKREAQVLAALNHPGIAAIYGFEDSSTTHALVMELVEGPTLADLIAHGHGTPEAESLRSRPRDQGGSAIASGGGAPRALSIDDALPIARQIAEALEAAHEQGIIHRDLKPANIKVRHDGTVKVLDFGLAKALEPAGAAGSPSVTMSPTITTPAMTAAGLILGTAAYMSPEQAKGRPVDRRADIWAYGCVLYEMLTGQRAFAGGDVSEVLASVLAREPDWTRLPTGLSPTIGAFIRGCLRKEAKQRVGDIRDVRLALEGAFESQGPAVTTPADSVRVRPWQQPAAIAVLAMVTAASVALSGWALVRRGRAESRPTLRLTVPVPADVELEEELNQFPQLALSPDGRVLVYAGRRDGVVQLYRRPLDQFSSAPIAGTVGGTMPFFSPDGQWIGFFADGEMRKIRSDGGDPATVAKSGPANASWGTDDGIVFSRMVFGSTLQRVSASGGNAIALTALDAAGGDYIHALPEVLPGSRAVLFVAGPSGKIFAQPLPDGTPKELVDGAWPSYVSPGYLTFVREDSLWAVPFNAERIEVTGPAVRLIEGILGAPRVANDGTLVYLSGVPQRVQLVWVTRQGHEETANLDASGRIADVALSPDGKRVVVSRYSSLSSADLWIGDFARRSLNRLTTEGLNVFPLWTRDGGSVVYSSTTGGGRNIFRRAADGSGEAERLTQSPNQQSPWTWSKDGRTLVLNELRGTIDLTTVSADGQTASVLVEGPGADRTGAVSPDGRWIAYQSNEFGTTQVVVRPFPNVNAHRWQVSTDGGGEPKWSPDGRELFYRHGAAVMRVEIGTNPGAEAPEKLFEGHYVQSVGEKSWDVAPDGRFLMKKLVKPEYSINVVLNWQEELKRVMPTK